MPNASIITPELISRLSLTPDGQYYTGSINETFYAFSTTEVVNVLGDAYGVHPESDAKAVATQTVAKNGDIKTGVHGAVCAYVDKIRDAATPQNPLKDYEIYQSVDPTSDYGKDIVARKIKAHHWARKHKKELSEEQKSDAALLANTAVDEVDYAGPKLLTELLGKADKETREAVLVFSTAVLKGELKGQVNTISPEGKGEWAQVTYQFLKSDNQTVDPQIAESSYRAVIVYYTENPQVAEEQGIDLKELLAHPLAKASTSDASTESPTIGMIGVTTGEQAEDTPLVDPVALTTASLKQQISERVSQVDTTVKTASTESPLTLDHIAPLDAPIEIVATESLSSESPEAIPLSHMVASLRASDTVRVDGQNGDPMDHMLPLIAGLNAFYVRDELSTGPASGVGLNSEEAVFAPHLGRTLDLNQKSAEAVHSALPAPKLASEVVANTRSEGRRPEQGAGFDITAVLEGAFEAFVAPSERSDATTRAQDLADDSVLTGLAGAQAAVLASLAHYGRGFVAAVGAGRPSHSHGAVERTSQQANSGDHQENNREGREGDQQSQHQQDGQRQAWYEPREASEHSAEAA